ncbi:DUF262 domain-containing protein [Candidatus Oscillochloris fontis]|uniref:DUF262 domain-containing protein n=1 Tax=Candidatus Oscillochloris fontis TaxID=2496868 RepID=UPI00101DA226|nr:DUF262 domain-containing protein [Candidatus Oscillochloris fontis]
MRSSNETQTRVRSHVAEDEKIPILLRALSLLGPDPHSAEEIAEIFEATDALPELSNQERRELLQQATNLTPIVLYDAAAQTWQLMPAGYDRLDEISTATEIIDDETTIPFDPADIRFEVGQDSIFSILQQIEDSAIIIAPDFQRHFVWDSVRQSQLIESILLRIPLPPIYLSAERDDTLVVMDGLQRLTTLKRFCSDKTLKLKGLRYLKELEGKGFHDLHPPQRQILLHRTKLTLYTVTSSTPKEVRFEIFSRVNRGGLTLTAQEIRNALYQGKATTMLKELAESEDFLRVTGRSINARRMDDRECVLRFLAFTLERYDRFGNTNDPKAPRNLDSLLNRTMEILNQHSDSRNQSLDHLFKESLRKAELLFGELAFRKIDRDAFDRRHLSETGQYQWAGGKRNPISKALFEIWTVLLIPYSQEQVSMQRNAIIEGFLALLNDESFLKAISLATGGRDAIMYRFSKLELLLNEALS